MREALGARELAAFEAELGEAEAADTGGERPVTGGGRRGDLHEDPVVFALTDRVSWLTVAYVGGVIAVSL